MVGRAGGIEGVNGGGVNGGDVVVDAVGFFSDNECKKKRKHPQITQITQIFKRIIKRKGRRIFTWIYRMNRMEILREENREWTRINANKN